jgi:hypothetical protein
MKYDLDVPMPETMVNGMFPRARKYPFPEMPVGASVAVAKDEGDKLCSAAKQWKKRHPGWDYRSHSTDSEVRLWRVA